LSFTSDLDILKSRVKQDLRHFIESFVRDLAF
jgi:hypothetical protein